MIDFIKQLFAKLFSKKETIVVQVQTINQVEEPAAWPFPTATETLGDGTKPAKVAKVKTSKPRNQPAPKAAAKPKKPKAAK